MSPGVPALPERLPDVPGFPPGSLPRRIAALTAAVPPWEPMPARRPSAVVLLFIPPETPGEPARVVFMKRSTTVRTHKGQIGLAGGRREESDASPLVTALRELEEELGVPPEQVVPLGALPRTRALDGSAVLPVVAAANVPLAALTPAPAEVDEVFAVPWTALTADSCQEFAFNIFGAWRRSRAFRPGGLNIWGLTAHVLYTAGLE